MLLQKIALKNFRQFYGKQEIIFSTDQQKNVTLIHAENGVGKTTLLNALLWCFYETTTERFESPDKIVSHQALEEGISEASVEVFLLHEGKTYCVQRTVNEKFDEHTFEASEISSGNYIKLSEPRLFVDSVIPREMSRYFFFDGEYAETFSSNNNKRAVQTAIESMLGCNLAIQASKDFSSVIKLLDKKIGALTKNNAASAFQTRIEQLEAEDSEDREELERLDKRLEELRLYKLKIQNQLGNTKGAAEVEKKWKELRLELVSLRKRRSQIDARETQWIYEDSIGFFADAVRSACLTVIVDANAKGHIPSKIADTFVTDILERGTCICGRAFSEHSEEETSIRSLIKEAGTATMSDRLMSIRGKIGELEKAEKSANSIYQEINKDRNELEENINKIEMEIESCDTELRGSNVREIAERQSALDRSEQEYADLLTKKGGIEKACEDREIKISENKQKRDKLLAETDEAADLQKQVALLKASKAKLETELENYRTLSRHNISDTVNGILEVAARRNYTSQIDESFSLSMHYADSDVPVAKSSGENQLLSLAFISSLIRFSAERAEDERHLLKPGTLAPLMLDSPFGQLDPSYRKSTSEFLPKLSGQVILLLSKTQGDEQVLEVLKPYINNEYVLVSEVKTTQGEKPVDIITLEGKDIKASIYGAEKNQTRIVPV